ncbi:MAG: Gmad2 immunoglobulin-like domain-containing protein [Chloroflexota bacterium]
MRREIWLSMFFVSLLVLSGCGVARPSAAPVPPEGVKAQPTPTKAVPAPKATSPSPTPKPASAPKAASTPSTNITVTAPVSGAKISSPVRIRGTARVFEGHLELEVKDASGKVIGKGTTLVTVGAPEWGSFEAAVTFEAPKSEQQGTVEVFTRSARDGSLQDLAAVRVTLLPQ